MNKKIYIGIGIICVMTIVVVAIIGIKKKETYTDPLHEGNGIYDINVAMCPDRAIPVMEGTLINTILENTSNVIKVEGLEPVEFDFNANSIKVKVLDVFDGEGLSVGDEIYINRGAWCYFDDDNSMNMSFVNFMQPGEEYLVYIAYKADEEIIGKPMYTVDGYTVYPIFNYEDKEDKIVDQVYARYGDVCENEFFPSSQATLDAWRVFKKTMMAEYGQTSK